MATIPNQQNTAGIPAQYTETLTAVNPSLITGHTPALMSEDMIFANGQNIPALTPVMFSAGVLVVAVQGTVAVGITAVAVVTAAAGIAAPVYRQGVFNPDAINWPASSDLESERFAAFAGAPTPTSIVVRKPKSGSL